MNRKLDCDYSDGIDVIRAIKRRAEFTQLPVMMITNLAEHHQLAMAAGAEKGFGKQALSSNETLDLLARFL